MSLDKLFKEVLSSREEEGYWVLLKKYKDSVDLILENKSLEEKVKTLLDLINIIKKENENFQILLDHDIKQYLSFIQNPDLTNNPLLIIKVLTIIFSFLDSIYLDNLNSVESVEFYEKYKTKFNLKNSLLNFYQEEELEGVDCDLEIEGLEGFYNISFFNFYYNSEWAGFSNKRKCWTEDGYLYIADDGIGVKEEYLEEIGEKGKSFRGSSGVGLKNFDKAQVDISFSNDGLDSFFYSDDDYKQKELDNKVRKFESVGTKNYKLEPTHNKKGLLIKIKLEM